MQQQQSRCMGVVGCRGSRYTICWELGEEGKNHCTIDQGSGVWSKRAEQCGKASSSVQPLTFAMLQTSYDGPVHLLQLHTTSHCQRTWPVGRPAGAQQSATHLAPSARARPTRSGSFGSASGASSCTSPPPPGDTLADPPLDPRDVLHSSVAVPAHVDNRQWQSP